MASVFKRLDLIEKRMDGQLNEMNRSMKSIVMRFDEMEKRVGAIEKAICQY